MFVELVRLLVVLMVTGAGYSVGLDLDRPVMGASLGAGVGYVVGGVLGRGLRRAMGTVEQRVADVPAGDVLVGGLGGLVSGIAGALLGLPAVVTLPDWWGWPMVALTSVLGAHVGYRLFARRSAELLELIGLQFAPLTPPTDLEDSATLVDVSAAVDGRIVVLADQGFIRGTLAVPRPVIDRLRSMADAADVPTRRAGRRGLEALDALRGAGRVRVHVIDDDPVGVEGLDAKIVAIAGRLALPLVSCDAELIGAARAQGIRCLDPSRLSESLRGGYVPGKTIRLPISREGKEPGQGVGFLDDGSMVVVSHAAADVGHEVDVVLTSEVETKIGRLFFASRSDP